MNRMNWNFEFFDRYTYTTRLENAKIKDFCVVILGVVALWGRNFFLENLNF